MTILVVVISILGRIVTDTQRVWRQGADAAELSLRVRAACAILDSDVGSAVASSNLLFRLQDSSEGYPELFFHRLALDPDPAEFRAFQQAHVFVATNGFGLLSLRRTLRLVPLDLPVSNPDNSLWSDDWMSSIATNTAAPLLLDNISAMAVTAIYPDDSSDPSDPTDPTAPFARTEVYDSADQTNALPLALDLEVEVLPDRSARRYGLLPEGQRDAFVRQHAVRFAHRVHVRNREGGLLP